MAISRAERIELGPRTTSHRAIVRRVLLGSAIGLVVLAASSLYVLWPAAQDLRAAQKVLATTRGDIGTQELAEAMQRLQDARGRLRSFPGRLLGMVPVLRQNIAAIDELSSHAISALGGGSDLATMMDRRMLVVGGRLDLDRLAAAADRATDTARSLNDLLVSIDSHRSGWLLPSLWHSLRAFEPTVTKMQGDIDRAAAFLRAAPTVLGAEEKRTYLVMLTNNAELRGTGGIPSGIGTVSVRDGRFTIGSFDYYRELAGRSSIRKVPAPAEFTARYGRYQADTTHFVNSTMSPDVPDVALVVSRLYRRVTGVGADGVLFADPHGIAALIPRKERIVVPGVSGSLRASDVARFVYSDAYELFEGSNTQRRDALLQIGKSAFSGLASGDALTSLEPSALLSAAGGGHLRLVSFDQRERTLLDRSGVSGDLMSSSDDSVFVTVQNFGGDKLDYWVDRTIEHSCRITGGGAALCSTQVRLANDAPRDLPAYVTQQKQDAVSESFLEIYVPDDARISGLTLNRKPVRYSLQKEDGRVAAGVYVEIVRGRSITLRADYELDLAAGGYSLELRPQPLARPARIAVRVQLPAEWSKPSLVYEGDLDRTLWLEAGPTPRPSGLTRLWEGFEAFWSNPVEIG